jgi:hypothetical protein
MVAPFDLSRLEKTGSATVVLTGIRQTDIGAAQITFSQTGSMAYVPTGGYGRRDTLVWGRPLGRRTPNSRDR